MAAATPPKLGPSLSCCCSSQPHIGNPAGHTVSLSAAAALPCAPALSAAAALPCALPSPSCVRELSCCSPLPQKTLSSCAAEGQLLLRLANVSSPPPSLLLQKRREIQKKAAGRSLDLFRTRRNPEKPGQQNLRKSVNLNQWLTLLSVQGILRVVNLVS